VKIAYVGQIPQKNRPFQPTFPELGERVGEVVADGHCNHLWSRDQSTPHKNLPGLKTVSNLSAWAGGEALLFNSNIQQQYLDSNKSVHLWWR